MTIEEVLVTLVSSLPAVTALIGSNPTRLYPVRIPQNTTLPCAAWQRVSTPRVTSHQGFSHLALPRFQVTVWGKTYAATKTVADALTSGLVGTHATIGGLRIDAILPMGEHEDFEPTTQIYQRYLDYQIIHQEL